MTLADGAGQYAGPLGLLVVLLLGVSLVLLIRSMNKRLRRLPDRFPPGGPDETPPTSGPEA